MSHWINPTIDLGEFMEEQVFNLKFKTQLLTPGVAHIIPLCGCTKLKFYPTEGELHVTFKSGKVPNQSGNSQKINKIIEVFYLGGTKEELSITGTKIKNNG